MWSRSPRRSQLELLTANRTALNTMNAILGLSSVSSRYSSSPAVWPSLPPSGRSVRSGKPTPVEYDRSFPMPKDFRTPGEWVFARLMYPPVGRYYGGFQFLGSWKEGVSNWAMDYPRSDRHFAAAVRRLTQVNARSVEQLVDLDEHEVYDWPWLYGVEVGHWDLTDDQAKTMREYLLRGGFFMCDDFHGSIEWDVFAASMRKVFPDRTDRRSRSQRRRSFTSSTISTTGIRSPARCSSKPPHLREGRERQDPALARHLRRPRPPDGGHLP